MQRSRLKNIINKSKALNQKIEPFNAFKKSLPKEIEIGDNYRLEAAWKAYGSPKNYQEALWEGMIQPIDENTYKLPSIGYNEETDEYEYLNKGRENETVAKDIRVWDNDVIPLVKELKLGGYVRTFNKEKDCWTYTKNSQKENTLDLNQFNILKELSGELIDSFLKGGKSKPKFEDWYKTVPQEKNDTTNYDLEKAYNELPFEELELFRTIPEKHLDGRFKKPNHMTYSDEGYGWIGSDKIGWTFYPSPRQLLLYPYEKYVEYWNQNEPNSILNYNGKIYKVSPQTFQLGRKSEYKKVKSDRAYYDKNSDTIYYTNDEDLIHEGFHARPDSVLLEQLRPYYENLNDERILNFGGNLLFVKRFEGDPGHFYSPEELGARVSAAKFRTKGNSYTPEFFKYLRTNENLYGDNMRDLLYMYNDENLSKIFNLGNTQAFKQGGLMNVIPEGALHARKNNMEGAGEDFTAKGIPVMSNDGELVAEIEKNEIVFNKEVTDFIEENYKKFYSDKVSNSEKDEIAIKVGKRLVKEILKNTDDRTGLIEEIANKNNLEYNK